MESIIINPETQQESDLIKAMLKKMRMRFTAYNEEDEVEVSSDELEAIDKGLEDVRNGNVTSHDDAKRIFHDAIYQMEQ